MTQRRYRGMPGWMSIITIATITSLAQVVWTEEPAEVAKAKTETWKPISIRFYRWKFGEKNHLRAEQIVHVAENILAAQNKDGGWSKNNDLSTLKKPTTSGKSTFDNKTIYTQVMYLARVRRQTGLTRYDEAIQQGIEYTLKEQSLKSGGWRGADVDAVTFNDDVMANLMTLLYEIVSDDDLYGWLNQALRRKAKTAYDTGLACILACQVKQGETLTAWGQQHSHDTLNPCWARNYEPPCITAGESVGVIRFLMTIDNPSKEVVQSIQAAVKWLNSVKLNQVRVKVPDKNYKKRGFDILIIEDLKDPRIAANESWGPPIWARMYHPETNKALLYDRGRKLLTTFSEMQQERRTGYGWHGTWPAKLLNEEYPEWQRKWAPDRNVLRTDQE